MTVLVITGTRFGRLDFEHWADRWVVKFGLPTKLVLGDSWRWCRKDGVDGQANQWALERGYADLVCIEYARLVALSPYRFHERDQRMANHVGPGDWCLGFPIAGSRGTYLTMNMCRKRGARVFECPLRSL